MCSFDFNYLFLTYMFPGMMQLASMQAQGGANFVNMQQPPQQMQNMPNGQPMPPQVMMPPQMVQCILNIFIFELNFNH